MGKVFKDGGFSSYIVIKIIRFYQKTLSFDHGIMKVFAPYGRCKFRPTCSEYAIQAVNKYGVIRGGFKALARVLRCHPWSKGGYDPLN
ncbi:membrane protein insertion efficiency factor YidD [Candidatus Falkowbacteria bacterium]|nr:membrane protein insertion efficiency factor YidD [Candidatus Falkowbacteria bacterium]